MADIVKTYTNGEITIEWRPELCEHSANCFRSLPNVFNPRVRPWIQPENAASADLAAVVRRCPSGALSLQNDPLAVSEPVEIDVTPNTEVVVEANASITPVIIEVEPGGPYKVRGKVTVKNNDGTDEVKDTLIELCRCGKSKTKPYCDYTHEKFPGWDDEL
jgi:uncharacterized Fe-S cluster protein YjdI